MCQDIFIRDNLTDFEKLLYSQKEVEQLKKENSRLNIEIGILKSEISELEYNINEKSSGSHGNWLRVSKELKQTKEQFQLLKNRYDKTIVELINIKTSKTNSTS
jgi:predicted  nucleic acid-binding Zn-ribbon protein